MKRYIRSNYTDPDDVLRQKYIDDGVIDDSDAYNDIDDDYNPILEMRLTKQLNTIRDDEELRNRLDQYADSTDVNKRVAAAKHHMTRRATLLKLAEDKSDVVLGCLIFNPNTPSSVPRKLIADLKGTPRNYRRLLKRDLRQWSADNR